jgi:hypothetical protein
MRPTVCKTIGIAEKRTKAEKWQRQADQLEKKSERPPVLLRQARKKYARTLAESLDLTPNLPPVVCVGRQSRRSVCLMPCAEGVKN